MTTVVTVLFGAGILFIASALECQPLVDTFQKIINGDTIDWSGSSGCGTAAGNATEGTLPSASVTAPNGVGQCPPGYSLGTDGQCHSTGVSL
jgi:hypothetical protein